MSAEGPPGARNDEGPTATVEPLADQISDSAEIKGSKPYESDVTAEVFAALERLGLEPARYEDDGTIGARCPVHGGDYDLSVFTTPYGLGITCEAGCHRLAVLEILGCQHLERHLYARVEPPYTGAAQGLTS